MAYCPDCGARSENGAPACSSCGLVFPTGSPAADPKADISGDQHATLPRSFSSRETGGAPGEAPGGDWQSDYLIRGSQLGKGTIKPCSVELGIDGYHFKFEEPARRVGKQEPSKDKTKEFRVTYDDLNRQAQAQQLFPETKEEQAVDSSQNGYTGEKDANIISDELNWNNGDDLALSDLPVSLGSDTPDSIAKPDDSPDMPRSDAESEASGPEMENSPEAEFHPEESIIAPEDMLPVEADLDKTSGPPEETKPDECPTRIFWKGTRSFWGIPLQERYQITSHAIIVETQRSGRRFEYSLSAVITAAIRQSWLEKIAGTGNVAIKVAAGPDIVELDLKGIPDPLKVLKILADLIGPKYNERHG